VGEFKGVLPMANGAIGLGNFEKNGCAFGQPSSKYAIVLLIDKFCFFSKEI